MSVRNELLNNFGSISNRFAQKISVYYALNCSDSLGISYFELNRVSSELSHFFSNLLGKNSQYVGVSLSDYFLLPCIILGIWKSGNCFAGVGTQYTRQNTEDFLNFLGVKYIITDVDKNEYGGESISRFFIHRWQFFVWCRQTEGEVSCTEDICYGIMTSGSTGEPKIIQVPWSCILPNAVELCTEFHVTELDCIFLASPYSFDPFFIELLMALLKGSTLMVVSNDAKLCPSDLLKTLFYSTVNNSVSSPFSCEHTEHENYFHIKLQKVNKKNVSILQMTPSIFRRWTDNEIKHSILSIKTSLRILILGGEKFPKEILKLKHPSNTTRIFNIYGITEISCWTFLNEVSLANNSSIDSEISIGRPLNGITHRISENGELEIGSFERICLVNEERTFKSENAVYRETGDIIKLSNGEMYCIGRSNQVVKKYGMKINLSNIEDAFMNENKLIKNCFCIIDEESLKLGLFYQLISTGSKEKNYKLISVEEFYKNNYKIPECIKSIEKPDYFIEITEIPINSHGKCDKNQLLQYLKDVCKHKQHELDINIVFKKLWTESLGIADVNFHSTDFLAFGGNSVLGLDLINKLEDEGFRVPQNFIAQLLGGKSYDTCLECLCLAQEKSEIPKKRIKLDRKFGCVTLSEVWKFDLGKCVDASGVVFAYEGEERLVIGSHSSKLSCINPDSGCEIWSIFLGDRIESGFTPAKDGSRGFIGCYDHCVYCIATSNGSLIWKFKTGDMVKSTPCLSTDQKTVYVASYDKHLYCLSATDGKPLRTVKLSNGGVRCPGIVSDSFNSFFIGTLDGTCLAINQETNEPIWKTVLETPIFSAPCLIPEKPEVLFSEVLGNVHCLNALNGDKMWTFKAGGNIYSSPTAEEVRGTLHIIFGCHDAHLYCLQYEKQPELKWKQQLDSSVFAKPLMVFDFSSACAISTKGFVYLCDFGSGAVKARLQLNGEVFSSAVYRKNRLFVGCRDNNVYSLEISKTINQLEC